MRTLSVLGLLLCSVVSYATILPPNNLHLKDRLDRDSNMTEAQFNQAIDTVIKLWEPLATLHKGTLKSTKLWTDPTVNASANKSGGIWEVTMYGGLARADEMTID